MTINKCLKLGQYNTRERERERERERVLLKRNDHGSYRAAPER